MSPDGTKIAYRVIKGRRDEVWVHDIATSTRKKLLTRSKDVEADFMGERQPTYFCPYTKKCQCTALS